MPVIFLNNVRVMGLFRVLARIEATLQVLAGEMNDVNKRGRGAGGSSWT